MDDFDDMISISDNESGNSNKDIKRIYLNVKTDYTDSQKGNRESPKQTVFEQNFSFENNVASGRLSHMSSDAKQLIDSRREKGKSSFTPSFCNHRV
jgi:hypothetical protein